ncbi:MAG: Asp-tRNA(Asn)/Glu-tRNA(Gln) amidotransferase subunit GatB [Rhodospirillaceae bacterium]|jgi:aspartyl-tRNA(Asn)/glutamyl-tRNA(Gln) amidotransferase subunit B|nr:Asp-tRNA(Asn)/Glu-tRNA(Gln) amidotransferase subunit GatB [Rhodospirillaceae bacterium]MBT4218833.1 Asp-tRNA(Asn)/Glu-tRNA(Gln) amidotransferase subunit GatB [Rhodospirillaceae bacterium]MBT5013936.1 Asp-tRNA(Asn)/Glu-tRNA(Gln) amidotransferase subunit GatB [Rhodospirillaceae bacterium]MBT5309035.1 Asp-tRNA(Asn)/Glu-tRNA(Gln) amidotransferase subunit GatB [Rhodospirillaceae bacterium]MBT6406862.1 Asp-tRNA(Asn)/Glu-tRNA(Gln) amidotransferase subunit GatB [Rhodospirillaceae bacterium]
MSYVIPGENGDWEVVIGLEVHAQIISKSKLFSGAATTFGSEPNTQVSLVDAAMPGMLPVINEECIEQAVRTGLGLKAEINLTSVFDRKNYFYADLPQGYQISQLYHPIVGEGTVTLDLDDGSTRDVGIERLHMEQDAGKSVHDLDPKRSFIDLNRSGTALMEIVSRPDLRSPEDVGAYLRKLRSILRYLGTCDGNMDEGSMRCDVNVSVRPVGETDLRNRAEVKNVNSVRFAMQAVEIEARRQIGIYDDGGDVAQETRLFDSVKSETRSMRSKEFAHDYRYFPDPDLLPLVLTQDFVDAIEAELPELPDARKQRYMSDFGLSAYDAGVLVAERETAAYYEIVAGGHDPKLAANWVITNLFAVLKDKGVSISDSPVSAKELSGLLDLITDDTISGRIAKDVFEVMVETGKDAASIVEEKGLKQITDGGAIEAAIDQIIADNPDQVAQYQGGNEKIAGWFVGQVMKATQGKANPGMVNKMLADKLKG